MMLLGNQVRIVVGLLIHEQLPNVLILIGED
jgi:hypothetical protein